MKPAIGKSGVSCCDTSKSPATASRQAGAMSAAGSKAPHMALA